MNIYKVFGIKNFVSVELYDRTKSDLKDFIGDFDFIFACYYIYENNYSTQYTFFLDKSGNESRITRNGWQIDSIRPKFKGVGYEIRIQDPEGKTNWSAAFEYKDTFYDIIGRSFFEGKYYNSPVNEYVLNNLLERFKYFTEFKNWDDLVLKAELSSEFKPSIVGMVVNLEEKVESLKTDIEQLKKRLGI